MKRICGVYGWAWALMFAFAPSSATAQKPDQFPGGKPGPENTLGTQSDSDIWRAVREGAEALPAGSTPKAEAGMLINANGVWWADVHQYQIVPYSIMALLGIALAISLFFAVRGRIRIDGGRSGRTITRFSILQRITHWSTALLFILMTVTGLILLFGRAELMPRIGKSAFSVIATAAMQAHNLFGPLFMLAILVLFAAFVRGNFPALADISWLLRGGGLIGGHASAGRYNFGEKVWFWFAVTCGIALSVTGIVLLFPDTLAVRDQVQLANLVHAIAAVGVIGFAFGHIYLGTIGTEGTLEGMVHGEVDENWARSHHDIWLGDMVSKSEEPIE